MSRLTSTLTAPESAVISFHDSVTAQIVHPLSATLLSMWSLNPFTVSDPLTLKLFKIYYTLHSPHQIISFPAQKFLWGLTTPIVIILIAPFLVLPFQLPQLSVIHHPFRCVCFLSIFLPSFLPDTALQWKYGTFLSSCHGCNLPVSCAISIASSYLN